MLYRFLDKKVKFCYNFYRQTKGVTGVMRDKSTTLAEIGLACLNL